MLIKVNDDTSVIFNKHNISFTQTKKELKARINAYDADDNQYWLEWQNIKDVDSIDYQHPDKIVMHKKTYLRPHEETNCYLCNAELQDDDLNFYIPGISHASSHKNLRRICTNCADQLIDLTTINNLIDNVTFADWGFPFNQLPENDHRYLVNEQTIDQCQNCQKLGPSDIFKNHLCPSCVKLKKEEESHDDQTE